MGTPAVQVELQASVAAFKAQMQGAADSMRSIMRGMGESVSRIAPHAHGAGQAVNGLSGAIQRYGMQEKMQQRLSHVLAMDLEGMGLSATGAAGSLVRLGSAFAFGGALGVAIEGAKVLAQTIFSQGKEAEEAKKKWEAFTTKLAADAEELRDKLRFLGQPEGTKEAAKIAEKLAASQAKLARATRDFNEAQDEWSFAKAGSEVADFTKEVQALEVAAERAVEKVGLVLTISGVEAKEKADKKASEDRKRRILEEAAEVHRLQNEAAQVGLDEIERLEVERDQKINDLKIADRERALRAILALEQIYGARIQVVREKLRGDEMEEDARETDRRAKELEKEQREAEAKAARIGAAWRQTAISAGSALSELGAAFGGNAGKMLSVMGELIQKAVQMAVAMSAQLPPPFGVINMLATAASILATLASIPKYEMGTPYVPRTGLAMVHEGERITPAGENRWGGGLSISISALDGADVERTLVRNQRAVLRLQARMERNRRRS